MISEPSYALLKMVESAPDGLFLSGDDQARASALAKQGLLEQKFKQRDDHGPWSYAYFLTPLGKDAILAFEKEREKNAREDAEKEAKDTLEEKRRRRDARRSWIQWVFGGLFTLLVAIIGTILGAFLSTETHWLDWLPGIWKRFL